MPRKTLPLVGPDAGCRDRFNEAAARCRGKLQGADQTGDLLPGASMRPRPDAAENGRGGV